MDFKTDPLHNDPKIKAVYMKTRLKALFLIPFTALWICSSAYAFTPPKSDAGLELLIDLLEPVLNFSLQEIATPRVLRDEIVSSHESYDIRSVELKSGDLGRITLRIKVPKQGRGQYPVVFVLPGLNMSPSLFDANVDQTREVIQVLVDYSFPPRLSKGKLIYEVVRKSLNLQLLSSVALNWVKNHPMVDSSRISVVSVSYGTFVAPLSVRLAQLLGLDPYAVVFTYGGSDLKSLIFPTLQEAMSEADFENIRKPLSRFLDIASPTNHLPHLQTQTAYLVVKGVADEVIPSESTQVLIERLPDPKEVIELPTDHINPGAPKTIRQTIGVVMDWLEFQGAF